MSNIILEATNNIRAMHEIESIINNDDIPIESRKYFVQFVLSSLHNKRTVKQQKNITVFRDLFVRIDKDTRLFRTLLNVAVDLAEHFNFNNVSLVYALKNISLEEHFTNFVDFARRENPIIAKNSPLQLYLTLGLSIIKLALQKNRNETLKRFNENMKKSLFKKYAELSKSMSEHFINMDFGDFVAQSQQQNYTKNNSDLNDFNRDDDDDDDHDNIDEIITEDTFNTSKSSIDKVNNSSVRMTVVADIHPEKDINNNTTTTVTVDNSVPEYIITEEEDDDDDDNEEKKDKIGSGFSSLEDCLDDNENYDIIITNNVENTLISPVLPTIHESTEIQQFDNSVDSDVPNNSDDIDSNPDLNISDLDEMLHILVHRDDNTTNRGDSSTSSDVDSGLVRDDMEFLKTLDNGDKELDLKQLDSLVMEAGRKFGSSVLSNVSMFDNINNIANNSQQNKKPDKIIQFNNNMHNIVDLMKH